MGYPARQMTSVDRFHAAVVAAHDAIKDAGFTPQIYEDGYYDPVDYEHMPSSWHYFKQRTSGGLWVALAADINVAADTVTENRILNTVVAPIMRRAGIAYICPATPSTFIPKHSGANQHLHCDVGPYGNTTGRDVRQSWAGNPDAGAPARVDTSGKIAADGVFGPATKRALQSALNKAGASLVVDGIFGIESAKALQRYLKAKVDKSLVIDGKWGPATTKALQGYLGTPRDGVISQPVSTAIAALQNRLNAGTF